MQVFTEIQTLLLHQKPFVCYIKPNATVWNLLVQDNEASIEFSGQNGFVFVPFQDGKKVVIPFEENAFLLIQPTLDFISSSKKDFLEAFNQLESSKKEDFYQMVISQEEEKARNFS